MSYTATETRTKPQAAKWFGVADPVTAARADDLAKTAAGFISVNKTKTGNTITRTYVFDTKENFTAFLTARSNNADEAARKAYNADNGISTSILGQ